MMKTSSFYISNPQKRMKYIQWRYSLCPEGAENMSLGSQLPDPCF